MTFGPQCSTVFFSINFKSKRWGSAMVHVPPFVGNIQYLTKKLQLHVPSNVHTCTIGGASQYTYSTYTCTCTCILKGICIHYDLRKTFNTCTCTNVHVAEFLIHFQAWAKLLNNGQCVHHWEYILSCFHVHNVQHVHVHNGQIMIV